MKKVILFFCFLTGISLNLSAQNTEHRKYRFGQSIIKISPAHLLGHFPTAQLGLEQRLTDKIALQCDFGVAINYDNSFQKRDVDMHGYKAKIELRRYIPTQSSNWRFFVAPELWYNHIDYKATRTYQVHDESQLNYLQYLKSPAHYRERSIALNMGAVFTSGRFVIDFQGGVATRFIRNKIVSPGSGYEVQSSDKNNLDIFHEAKSLNTILPTFDIRVGYIIK
ncbi:MAG TPA: hypothetical protein VL443_21360 [Cyclobacteriaceae bacterium]|nr:hypothetical protein [Cyclobacteriaceae bacterium]